MNERALDRLVHSVLDGTASDEERAALEQRLRTEPAARAQWASWEKLFETLATTPRPEPPPTLHAQIMAAVRREPAPVIPWSAAWKSFMARRPTLTVAYAAAFGIVAGSVLSLTATGILPSGAPTAPVSGTMARPPVTAAAPAVTRTEVPGTGVVLRTWRQGDGFHLEARGEAIEPGDIEIAYDPAELRMTAMRSPDAPAARTTIEPGRMRITTNGSTYFEVFWTLLTPVAAPIRVTARHGAHEGQTAIAVTAGVQDSPPSP